MKIRALERQEIEDIWTIDRAEVIESIYHHIENGKLVLESEHHDVRCWPEGERESYHPLLVDCFGRGGTFYGAFEECALTGVAALECRPMGRTQEQLQLKFLYVSRSKRNSGLGQALFDRIAAKARLLGARQLYISATPSENTINFYLRLGCRVTGDVDDALFMLEPNEEACATGRALLGDEVGLVAEDQIVNEGDLFGHGISWLAETH